MRAIEVEREAVHRLPELIAELLQEPAATAENPLRAWDAGSDIVLEAAGRRWAFEVKTSSSPGMVAAAAEQLNHVAGDAVPVLVVPYMTAAGAKAAAARGLNWVDLSGNAHLRDGLLYVSVQGRPDRLKARGRPASVFAPKSSRLSRALLRDPVRWWLQKELVARTGLDAGRVSRIVGRLDDDALLQREGPRLRPRDPDLLLDAWADEYRFDRHDIVTGHLSGSGVELAHELNQRLTDSAVDHAFTGLPAAWAIDRHARFRLVSVYVTGNPRVAADVVGLRLNERGANVQLIGPNDTGVFDGRRLIDDLPCVAPLQIYLDLLHLPERAAEAAAQMRADERLWRAGT